MLKLSVKDFEADIIKNASMRNYRLKTKNGKSQKKIEEIKNN